MLFTLYQIKNPKYSSSHSPHDTVQVMLMVASETGHVYTFATPKLQPMITSEAGKALIQTCLHQPEPLATPPEGNGDTQRRGRMSSSGYEETDLGGYLPVGSDPSKKVCLA